MIMVAHQNMTGEVEVFQFLGKKLIRRRLALVGKVAGDHTAFCITMVKDDIIDTCVESVLRIKPLKHLPRLNQMSVSDVKKFHHRKI